ncbi:MAG TPA: tRNA-dihydrouridine synthase, partial [Burkholderiaceae bacterium]|nr:tRNA-dihydrouridine synthase [Burkholderiaceae bacterium]
VQRALVAHLQDHYALYGEFTGVRSARKHIGWYVRQLPKEAEFRARMNTLESTDAQRVAVMQYLDGLGRPQDPLPYIARHGQERLMEPLAA